MDAEVFVPVLYNDKPEILMLWGNRGICIGGTDISYTVSYVLVSECRKLIRKGDIYSNPGPMFLVPNDRYTFDVLSDGSVKLRYLSGFDVSMYDYISYTVRCIQWFGCHDIKDKQKTGEWTNKVAIEDMRKSIEELKESVEIVSLNLEQMCSVIQEIDEDRFTKVKVIGYMRERKKIKDPAEYIRHIVKCFTEMHMTLTLIWKQYVVYHPLKNTIRDFLCRY